MALLAVLVTAPGCSRMFWRTQADFDSYNLLMQKSQDPRWDLPRLTVDPDPRARFSNFADPDHQPLPPDDPTAHHYMEWVDGMRGYKSWHKFGEDMSVENPQWLANFGLQPEVSQADWEEPSKPDPEAIAKGETTPVRDVPTIEDLSLEQAIELTNIHNRDYQTQIENLYISALQLSFDQFQFNVRFLGFGGRPTSGLSYINTPGVRDNVAFNNRFGVSQLMPSGGQWVVELANNTLWLFQGQNRTSSSSVLTYQLTQPLLLGAGRKIVLEGLTQSERDVLYNVRALARYRKGIFSTVVTGTGAGVFSAGSFSVGGTFGGNGSATSAVSIGSNATNGIGYLDLLQVQQQVINQRNNIRELLIQVERSRAQSQIPPGEELEKMPEGLVIPPEFDLQLTYDGIIKRLNWRFGPMTPEVRDQLLALSEDPAWRTAIGNLYSRVKAGVVPLELAQLLTRASSQITALRDQERGYLDNVDTYKLTLGLPIDFQIDIDTGLLKQFEFIDPRITRLEQAILAYQQEFSVIDERDPPVQDLRRIAAQLNQLRERVRTEGMTLVEEDVNRVDANLPRRLSELTRQEDREIVQQDVERNRLVFREVIQDIYRELGKDLGDLTDILGQDELTIEQRSAMLTELDRIRETLLQVSQNLKSVQVGLRSELIKLHDFNMTQADCVATALENRLDLMNARAQVMDARRQMEVAANRLESVLNIVTNGEIQSSGNSNPFDFRGDQSTFQVGVQFTAPLDQVQLRNTYRLTQISYERARRSYLALEDQIRNTIRAEWRLLQTSSLNFETTRQNLRIAALQLDSAIETFNQPARVGAGGAGGTGGQNQGLNLINALQSVLQAQNSLIQFWTQFEQTRINIHLDMDIMQVDERGIWIDPVYQNMGQDGEAGSNPTLSEPAHDNRLPPPARDYPAHRLPSRRSTRPRSPRYPHPSSRRRRRRSGGGSCGFRWECCWSADSSPGNSFHLTWACSAINSPH
ncbi:MAG: TolC family protein [Planctomycetaceae bacterium]|nr:TolC family protein [Planctomycetaceae bacterium]